MCALSSIFSVTQRDAIGGFSLSRLVQGREPELRHLASGAGPARLDASPADPGRRDAHVHVAGAACPWLQVRSILKALYVTLIGDCVRVTLHQDAPGFTARLVEVVSFEADRPVGVHGQQRVRRGAEDDGLFRDREVDRQHLDPVCRCEPDAADAAHLQQAEALGRVERPQGTLVGSGPGGRGLPAGPGSQRGRAVYRSLPGGYL